MAAVVTDQFRISNAGNFVDSVLDTDNSYYVFLGLPNPANPASGFGRTTTDSKWDENIPDPTDNLQYSSHYRDTAMFGKKITSANIRRLIRKVSWTTNTRYDMYRHDYSSYNLAPNSQLSRLYDSNYYVINSDYRVYVCIHNGSSGSNLKGNLSKDEPTFTDLEPSAAGTSGDGFVWKYLFTVPPSDIIKFDSTDYVVVPNDWATSTDTQVQNVRESGDSDINLNQLKTVYISNAGTGYQDGVVSILGDGTGGKVSIVTDNTGAITDAVITAGGSGYTYAIVDLGSVQPSGSIADPAELIPIIPPSRGHGYNIYSELGTDKVLVYARFDDSTKDFPVDTKFSQVGIIRNPTTFSSTTTIFTGSEYSSAYDNVSDTRVTVGANRLFRITLTVPAVDFDGLDDADSQYYFSLVQGPASSDTQVAQWYFGSPEESTGGMKVAGGDYSVLLQSSTGITSQVYTVFMVRVANTNSVGYQVYASSTAKIQLTAEDCGSY